MEHERLFPLYQCLPFFCTFGNKIESRFFGMVSRFGVLTLFLHFPHDLYGEKLIFVSWTPDTGYASGKIITCLHPLFLYSVTVGFHPLGFYRLQMLICSANQAYLPESCQVKPGAGHSCGHCSTAMPVLSVSAAGADRRTSPGDYEISRAGQEADA